MPMTPFFDEVWTDGACRRNGYPDAVGGAGVWFPYLPDDRLSEPLPPSPPPTNQRAELTAIVLALEVAHKRQAGVWSSNVQSPFFVLTVYTDSQYAVNCLTQWIFDWKRNEWRTANEESVRNADLIEEADRLRAKIEGEFGGGRVNFKWIPRAENTKADRLANDGCDKAERAIELQRNTYGGAYYN
ncbi:ribonuclease H1 [Mycena alexandri]|uniref:ribonuclease H n=1 Tax=Mycena alexandri TaxID=1745969 RepID=A0AAD6T643_9AGAR|nr:ribonuclease H1 [Mycena alexandri]